jgi:hypothetical protein
MQGHCLKTAQVVRSLILSWRDSKDWWWAMASVANFLQHHIHLAVGMPVGEVEEVECEWMCVVLGDSHVGPEATYQGSMSWELLAAASDEDITTMVCCADDSLSEAQVQLLAVLLTNNRSVFALLLVQPGQAKHALHEINVQGHWLIKLHPQWTSPKEMMIKQVEVKKMLKVGVIQPLHGPWASPVVLVMKKDGTTCFCINY